LARRFCDAKLWRHARPIPVVRPMVPTQEHSMACCAQVEMQSPADVLPQPVVRKSIFHPAGLVVATLNTRSMTSDAKMAKLCQWMLVNGIAVCALQETKRPEAETIALAGGFVYAGFAESIHRGGTGLLIHPKLAQSLKTTNATDDGRAALYDTTTTK
jgi:hypothetical protein